METHFSSVPPIAPPLALTPDFAFRISDLPSSIMHLASPNDKSKLLWGRAHSQGEQIHIQGENGAGIRTYHYSSKVPNPLVHSGPMGVPVRADGRRYGRSQPPRAIALADTIWKPKQTSKTTQNVFYKNQKRHVLESNNKI